MPRTFDVAVIGAGLVGLATALKLLEARPGLGVAVVEAAPAVAPHQSGHNSGVVHSGLYYVPGSHKARLCRSGRAELIAFAAERGIRYVERGKVVVALDASEFGRLDELHRRATANGLRGVRLIGPGELAELEPHAAGARALHVPEAGVIDYRLVARAYADVLAERGGTLVLGFPVRAVVRRGAQQLLVSDADALAARRIVACAGLWADRVWAIAGGGAEQHRIVPFRGDYYALRGASADAVRGLIYPVPDPSLPFLGVHFTRTVSGEVHIGPNAVPAMARDGYGRTDVRLRDALETLTYPGFRRMARRYARSGVGELWRDYVRRAYVRGARRYLPGLRSEDVEIGPSGVRAQCMRPDGALVDDFLLLGGGGGLHLLNAPSPAATASLAIGAHVASEALRIV